MERQGKVRGSVKISSLVVLILIVGASVFALATCADSNTTAAKRVDMQMLMGVHEQYQAGPNRTTPEGTRERYPHATVTREFKSGVITPQNLIPSLKTLCQATWDADMTCVVSFKFDPENVYNGKWQPHIEQAMRWIEDNKESERTIVVIWHEPEDDANDSFTGTKAKGRAFADGATFVRYFNKVHGWIKSANPRIRTSHAALGYGYRAKRGGPGDNSAWVADPTQWITNADIHSIDIYSGRSFPLEMTLETSAAFNRWKSTLPVGAKWGVSERGWIADTGKSVERANSIRSEFNWIASLPTGELPTFYIGWSTEGTENDPKLILDDNGRQALNEGFNLITNRLSIPVEPLPEPSPDPSMITCPLCHGAGEVPTDITYSIRVSR